MGLVANNDSDMGLTDGDAELLYIISAKLGQWWNLADLREQKLSLSSTREKEEYRKQTSHSAMSKDSRAAHKEF